MTPRFTRSDADTAAVTGASRGIGAALARVLAPRVRHLILVARDREALEQVAVPLRTAETDVTIVPTDLTDPALLEDLIETLAGERVSILVNNAGAGYGGTFESRPVEDWARITTLNIDALVALTHGVLPSMLEQGRGRVLNVGSIAGEQPCPYFAIYGATKSFVNDFSRAVDAEVRGRGDLRVGALLPGSTRTDFFDRAGIDTEKLPKKFQSPERVAEVGLSMIERGSAWRVSGLWNRLMVEGQRVLPRGIVTRLSAMALKGTAQ